MNAPAQDLTRLDPEKILVTARVLRERIEERFPGAGLVRVADRLVDVAAHARETCQSIARPNLRLRLTIGLVVLVLVLALVGGAAVAISSSTSGHLSWAELVQVAEAGANDLLLIGAAIYFFVSFETRIKRGRVVKALHQLRTLAHLIDAHQLTKTPELVDPEATVTAHSPKRNLSAFELGRYLDYCTELLALTGKVAALYGDGFDDSESLEAVNEVETLTVGLQGKIWQKLILLRLPALSAKPAEARAMAMAMTAPKPAPTDLTPS